MQMHAITANIRVFGRFDSKSAIQPLEFRQKLPDSVETRIQKSLKNESIAGESVAFQDRLADGGLLLIMQWATLFF